ncbi:uncharacterized protein C8Q71DRAFT_780776 [Rhodofomes roseus]|uniref:Uncharacterized protein n=1 Tax=Rhodofomes roseus TaxID=34475 RepID=A0ABQ8K5Q6_9APHY|nr:uncharacterized protein C8Q71DRAFT_780776 [Rhodofomes roseus]KAH9831854.1 hypothetical protein C8Q71DRAFT_780776 [Rhodofomes roseus]
MDNQADIPSMLAKGRTCVNERYRTSARSNIDPISYHCRSLVLPSDFDTSSQLPTNGLAHSVDSTMALDHDMCTVNMVTRRSTAPPTMDYDEYSPTQILDDVTVPCRTAPRRRAAESARVRGAQQLSDGGALDSQVTDSQYVHNLLASTADSEDYKLDGGSEDTSDIENVSAVDHGMSLHGTSTTAECHPCADSLVHMRRELGDLRRELSQLRSTVVLQATQIKIMEQDIAFLSLDPNEQTQVIRVPVRRGVTYSDRENSDSGHEESGSSQEQSEVAGRKRRRQDG